MSAKLHKPGPHESAHLHVTGRARYVVTMPVQGALYLFFR